MARRVKEKPAGLFGEWEVPPQKEFKPHLPVRPPARVTPLLRQTVTNLKAALDRGGDSMFAAFSVGCWVLTDEQLRRVASALIGELETEIR